MYIFFAPDITHSFYTLSETESKHCIKSMRLKKNAVIQLIDGKGYVYEARISDDNMRACTLEIVNKNYIGNPFHFYLHLAVAPTKNSDRFEWFVEKAVEIGISEISAVECKNSEKTKIKIERIERISIAALKQSMHSVLPIFNTQKTFETILKDAKEKQKFIAYCGEDTNAKPFLKQLCKPQTDTLILIGPEGDFTLEEIILAKQFGFLPVSLGNSRLRTETAALVACNTVHFVNQ